jgi:UDP-3-O-[3-hydroxymyristoyl] glucosamine N-acyltransferase
MGIKLSEIARLLGGEILGDGSVEIKGVSGLSEAVAGDISFLDRSELLPQAQNTRATALIVPLEVGECRQPFIRTENPRLAFAKVLELFEPPPTISPGIHPTAMVDPNVALGPGTAVGAYCVIQEGCEIGSGAIIFPLCYLGRNCKIGENTVLFPRVTLYDGVMIGKNCRINSGTVIGGEGFGYVKENGRHRRMPQIGTVVIGDEVDIGTNTTIDRSTTGSTKIGSGTKIDNLVQIAHNVTIGQNCCICGQVGISGSVKIGDRVVLAGQAGLKDHIEIGSDALVAAAAGVISNIPPSAFYSGYPARPHAEQMRIHAAQRRLPQLIKDFRELQKRLADLSPRSSSEETERK